MQLVIFTLVLFVVGSLLLLLKFFFKGVSEKPSIYEMERFNFKKQFKGGLYIIEKKRVICEGRNIGRFDFGYTNRKNVSEEDYRNHEVGDIFTPDWQLRQE